MHRIVEIRHLDLLLQHQLLDKLTTDSLVKGAGLMSACGQQYSVTQPKCRCFKSSTTRNWHPSARRISPYSL